MPLCPASDLDEAPAAVALLWRAMECPYVVLEAGAQLMGVYEKLIAWRPADIAYRTDMIKVAFKVPLLVARGDGGGG